MAVRTAKLNSGYDCPLMGYGTYQSKDAAQLKTALKAAIETGYRHIDTAAFYENEQIIGETLQELYDAKIIKREDVFITTKLLPSHHRREKVTECLKKSLEKLRTTYVDLYLIHFPVPFKFVEGQLVPFGPDGKVQIDLETRLENTWAGMEDCVNQKLARSIGLSSCNISQVERILKVCKIKPAMNQVESHPGFQNTKLMEFLHSKGIAMTAYSQFGSPGTTFYGKVMCDLKLLEDPRLIEIGKKYGKTSAHVILRWQMQRKVFLIPKSTTPARIADNFKVWDFELTDGDMKAIAAMDLNKRYFMLDLPGMKDHPDYPHAEDGGSC